MKMKAEHRHIPGWLMIRLSVVMFFSMMSLTACGQRISLLTVEGSKGRLKAVVHKPKLRGGQKCPFVVILHGFTGNKNEGLLVQISEGLQERGIGSVRFDFNGHGESDGPFEEMTIGNELEDAKAVLRTVRAMDWVDTRRIGLLGHSQGGLLTGLLAGELGVEQIKAIVQLAPAGNISEMTRKGQMLGTTFDVDNLPEYLTVWNHRVGRPYLQYAMQCRPYEVASKYKGSACVIHGSKDSAVPWEYGKRYADGYVRGKWVLQPDDGHGLRKHRAQTLGVIYRFFASSL